MSAIATTLGLAVRSQRESGLSPLAILNQSKIKGYDSAAAPASIYLAATVGRSFGQTALPDAIQKPQLKYGLTIRH
ncbi:hypothetical protein ACVDG5_003150 [Mesorhizobium sp. ORM6]